MSAHAGAIPTSAEELAQKHQKLLQEYSRLKAQHTVLKKGLIKEQSTTASLQGNVKEKEKELRKLQEQLDLLAFHNERLTKRIEAVQDGEQKGSHFSLLGGAVKKELERSTQALDAANADLAKKIEENEQLHDEISHIRETFTDHANGLHLQIATFEKRIEELQVEISSMQKDRRDQTSGLKQEKVTLQKEVETIKAELAEKTRILNENEKNLKQGDVDLRSEIESLRAILLAKAGDVEGKEPTQMPSLPAIVPACEALRVLEEQAKNYIYALREQTSLKGLPYEIAAQLKTSTATWSAETQALAKRVEESEAQVKELLESKQQGDHISAEKIAELEKTIEQLKVELNDQRDSERIAQLEQANARLEEQIKTKANDLISTQQALEEARKTNERLAQEISTKEKLLQEAQEKETDDKQTQADLPKKEDQFVYSNDDANEDEDEDEDEDEVFVYRGEDAVDVSNAVDGNPDSLESTNGEASQEGQQTNGIVKSESPESQARLAELEAYYENQLQQLTDKLQLADSKAVRFSKMVDTLKDRLSAENEENHRLVDENDRLQKEVIKVQELLDTTEKNYQQQLREMTEQYIEQMQQAQR
ncbi:hypothetical protein BJV82DRAFT_618558 [Fennellomyces sp. T-0311]|nr:hypothetical protein BJV82DRAFT_618558 [Fennellomyces sp. T-0311]